MGRFASGTTVPSISFGDLKKQRIPKRNFQEQKNVIKQFDQIDEMIDELQKKLIEMKKKREELNSLFQYK